MRGDLMKRATPLVVTPALDAFLHAHLRARRFEALGLQFLGLGIGEQFIGVYTINPDESLTPFVGKLNPLNAEQGSQFLRAWDFGTPEAPVPDPLSPECTSDPSAPAEALAQMAAQTGALHHPLADGHPCPGGFGA